ARYVLANAAETKIVVTMNARSLLHFFNLRCCNRAQWEIRALAYKMLAEVKKVAPLLFKNAGATCVATGSCPEGKMTCGKFSEMIKLREE
ncbi:MAG: FAD-dependent thymidylate synthase, partial [Schwartzia sp.]|nr:FAD-dependent thymidylate synthase [Schwartzia sp. (in: firmicutes)]